MKLIEKGTKLFNDGIPTNFGYAFSGVVDYNIKDAKVPPLRLKEWDFYQIVNNKFSMYAIIGYVSYATSINITLFEYEKNKSYYVGKLLPFKKVVMDNNASQDSSVIYDDKDYHLELRKVGQFRFIDFKANDKKLGQCSATIKLQETQKEHILVSTPFEKKKHFYLNQKNCLMRAYGSIRFGEKKYDLEDKSFGLLDWGRGVLPFKHQWVWGSGSGLVNGKLFGFNIGRFGNNEFGTENIFWYDGKSYKLGKVEITYNPDAYMDDWTYLSDDGLFSFKMKPVYDNHTKTKMLWVDNECHQVFGFFSGYIKIDDKLIEIKDFWAFTEFAHNRW